MKGILVDIVVHKLNVDPNLQPVKEKKRNIRLKQSRAVEEEVTKLLNNGFIREVKYL